MATTASGTVARTHDQRLVKYKLLYTTLKTLDEEDPMHFAVLSITNHLMEIKITDPLPKSTTIYSRL